MSRTQIINGWMDGKEYIQIFCINKNIINTQGKYSLEFRDLMIYSYISFRTKNDEKTNRKRIEKKFSFDWSSIRKSIEKLTSLNLLVVHEDKAMTALEPTGETSNWFVFCKNADFDRHWFDRIAKYRVYLTDKTEKKERKSNIETGKKNNKSMLSLKENAVFWRLISLCQQTDSREILKKDFQRKSGLALLCLMSDRGVANSLKRLQYLGLVEPQGKSFLVHKPAPNQMGFWKNRPPKKKKEETTAEELILSKDLKYRIGGAIDKNLLLLIDKLGRLATKRYGCEKDYQIIREAFQMVLDRYPKWKYDNLFVFTAYLEEVLKKAHKENKSPNSCAPLFRYLVEKELGKMGG